MKKNLGVVFLLLISFSMSHSAVGRRLTVDDYFRLKDVTDVQVSPDGKWIAYVTSNTDLQKNETSDDIHMVSAQGGEPIRLTTNEKDDSHPRWSPDNKYLAFLSERGEKKDQVYVMHRDGGEAQQLTDVKQGVDNFEWSPDSRNLVLTLGDRDPDDADDDVEGKSKKAKPPTVLTRLQFKYDEVGYLKDLYQHLYVFNLEKRSMRQLTNGPFDDAAPVWSSYTYNPQWSPDGKQILFTSNRSEDADMNRNTDVFVVSSEGGDPHKLTTNPGTDESPRWSPDGKWVVYQTNLRPDLIWYDTIHIAILPASGGEPKILTSSVDRNAYSPRFSRDGKTVYFLLEDQGTVKLASVPVAGGKIDTEVTDQKAISEYAESPSGFAVIASHHTSPGEVYWVSKGKSKAMTHLHDGLKTEISFGGTEKVKYSSKDGTAVEAFVTYPPNFDRGRKYPLILWIHGGPAAQYSEEFDFEPQLFAANDYIVLRPNPRGSTGYGVDFSRAIFSDWGNKDYEDVMSGVDFLISKGYVDENKMGVGGWSYGGMLTDFVITKTTRFKAAISGASEANYFLDYGIDHYQYEWEKEVGLPWEKPDLYIKMSPFFQIAKVKSPTLFMCGEQDANVPLINSEQLYMALRRLGIDTMLVVYHDEYHSFYKPSNLRDRLERFLAWYNHYVKGEGDRTPKI